MKASIRLVSLLALVLSSSACGVAATRAGPSAPRLVRITAEDWGTRTSASTLVRQARAAESAHYPITWKPNLMR